jgi:hypothetical protein
VRLLAGLAVFLLARTASAAPDEHERLIKQGVELRAKHKDKEALALFEKAYAINPTPRALAQIALAEQALADWAIAERYLLDALEKESDPWIKSRRSALEDALKTIREHLATLEIDGTQGAEVTLAGRSAGLLPLAKMLRVAAGEVMVRVSKQGFEPLERTLKLAANDTVREVFDLVATPPPAPPPPPPAPAPTVVTAAREESSFPILAYATGAGAALGIGAGIAALIVRVRHVDRYNNDSICLPPNGKTRDQNCMSDRTAANTDQTIAIAAFAAGGALAVATGVIVALSSGDDKATAALRCGPGPGLVGVACTFDVD